MSSPRRNLSQHQALNATESERMVPTDGEVNFLWSFIQGSIVIPETWNALLRGYGFCERHAWMHLGVEMSFRNEYLLGPTILYAGLIEKSLNALSSRRFSMRRLHAGGPCVLCALHIENAGAGVSPLERIERGRDSSALRTFASRLESIWSGWVCSDCLTHDGRDIAHNRCRRHLIASAKRRMAVDILAQRTLLLDLSGGVVRYQRSFSPSAPKAHERDRAALIGAIGWCSGWRPLLTQLS